MADNFFDDKDTVEDNFFDNQDVVKEKTPETKMSAADAAILGAQEGATFGLDDIVAGAAGAAGQFFGDLGSDYKAEDAAKKLAELGIQDPQGPQGLLDTYYEAKKGRESLKSKASDDQTAAYYSGLIGGGLLGGGAAGIAGKAAAKGTSMGAKAASKVLPQVGGSVVKEGIKAGAISGLTEGDSELLRGDIAGTATDVAGGAVLGGVVSKALPAVAKGIGKAVKGVGKMLPGGEDVATAFKYGKLGKALDLETVDADTIELGRKVLSEIQDAKGKIDIGKAKQELQKLGVTVNTEQEINEAILDLKKLSDVNLFGTSKAANVETGLKTVRGDNIEADKMQEILEKQNLLKQYQNANKQKQAIISGEKKVFDQSLKSGDEIEQIMDLNRPFEAIQDIPTDTSRGRIGGVQATFKNRGFDPETGEEVVDIYSKKITSDTTPFQPTRPQVIKDPSSGRNVALTEDLGSGKVAAKIGDVVPEGKDLSNMSIEEIDDIIAMINLETGVAKQSGASSDPALQRLRRLAGDLRNKSNDAISKTGAGDDVIKARKAYSDVSEAEAILGINAPQSMRKDVNQQLMVKDLGKAFGIQGGFSNRQDTKIAQELLGETLSPETLNQSNFLQKVNTLVGRNEGSDNITKASLYSQFIGKVPNVAGRGVKAVQDAPKKLIADMNKRVMKLAENSESMTKLAQSLQGAGKAGQEYSNALLKAAELPERSRNAVMYGLYQQPAFREMVKQYNPFDDGEGNEP